jgi:anti-sigma-K factor RskA
MSGANDDQYSLAGEYVLGLLDAQAAADVLRAAETDPALAEAIAYWQAQLDPLADTLGEVPPTAQLWDRIRADLEAPARSPRAVPPLRAITPPALFWRPVAMGALLLAACLAGVLVWTESVRQSEVPRVPAIALLTAQGSLAPSARLEVLASGNVVVVPLTKLPDLPGEQMDLWAWPREAPAPVLLGRIARDGGALPFRFPAREGTPVMITREKRGVGTPKTPGPTMYAGLLTVWR